MAYLVFSYKQKHNNLNGGKMLITGSMTTISSYDGKEFTQELETKEELIEFRKDFPDGNVVFEGDIDETKIINEQKDHYNEFCDARYYMQYYEKLDEKNHNDFVNEHIKNSIDEAVSDSSN